MNFPEGYFGTGIYDAEPYGQNQIPTLEQERQERKRKSAMYTEEIEELSHAVYIYWKAKEMVKSKQIEVDEANERAEQMWTEETDEVREQFRRAAVVQDIMLGNAMGKRKRKGKLDNAQNRAEYNPFLLFCKDHKETVREKGSRGKGMTTLSSMWKSLPEEEKQRYIDQSRANKAKDALKIDQMQNEEENSSNEE